MTTTTTTSVLSRAESLCEALVQGFIKYSIRSHLRSALNSDTLYESKYHQQRAEELENGIGAYKYYIESGRKYHKIWMETVDNSRSIHAFVDKVTGDVYKAASIKAPAKGVRFNLMNDASFNQVISTCDWAGSYLYIR